MNIESKLLLAFGTLVLLRFLTGCSPEPTPTTNRITPTPTEILIYPPEETQKPSYSMEPINTQVRTDDGMVMVYVPAGEFEMGTSDEQVNHIIKECSDLLDGNPSCRQEVCRAQPAHSVTLDSFWIDQTEVTNAMFTAFLNERGNQAENGVDWLEPGAGHRGIVYGHIREKDGTFTTLSGYEDHPVIEVSWYGAAAYCSWVGGRLPTEAEWEYAARGPEANIYPWGNNFDGEYTNYCDKLCSYEWHDTQWNDGASRWTSVGSYSQGASWVGALDMAGNVHEWASDYWSEFYNAQSPADNPTGPDSGTLRISRGGSWFDRSYRMSATCRKGLTPSSARMHWVGFRCVIPAEGQAKLSRTIMEQKQQH